MAPRGQRFARRLPPPESYGRSGGSRFLSAGLSLRRLAAYNVRTGLSSPADAGFIAPGTAPEPPAAPPAAPPCCAAPLAPDAFLDAPGPGIAGRAAGGEAWTPG